MLSSELKSNPSQLKSNLKIEAASKIESAAPPSTSTTHKNLQNKMSSINEQFQSTLKQAYAYPISEHPLVAQGYLRVGDTLSIHHPGATDWTVWSGDDYILSTHDKKLCLKNACDGTIIYTVAKFFCEVVEWCEAHDEDADADGENEDNHANTFKALVVDGNWTLPFIIINGRCDGSLDDWEPSADFKEASILLNEKAVLLCPAVPAKKVKKEQKRQPALGYDLSCLAADLNEGTEDTDKEFSLDFYILKREGIKTDAILRHDGDEWMLDCGDLGEYNTLKAAFISVNQQMRELHELKAINASCVGTKIMLSFLKFKGKLVSNLCCV